MAAPEVRPASFDQLHEGTRVRLLRHPSVLHRFPELVHANATVVNVPNYPNTWFTLRVEGDGRLVKVQTKALAVVSDPPADAGADVSDSAGAATTADARNGADADRNGGADATRAGSNGSAGAQPRENGGGAGTTAGRSSPARSPSRPRASSGKGRTGSTGGGSRARDGKRAALKRGDRVRVVATGSTQSRCPALIGSVGVVRSIPHPPKTWYKVEFPPDAKAGVTTFRASSLRRVEDGSGTEEEQGGTATAPSKAATSTTTASATATANVASSLFPDRTAFVKVRRAPARAHTLPTSVR